MSRFLNTKYRDLEAYVPGEQPRDMEYIKLNTNESPYPPAPSVIEAVNAAEVRNLRLYSDPECKILREKIALLYGMESENVILTNGSDDILNFAFMAFSGGDRKALFPDITYGFYKVFAELHGVEYDKIPLKEDFTVDYKDYCGVNSFIVIANPNAPTGISMPVWQIEEIVKSNPNNVVVIDEAYVDFGGESVYPLIEKYDNLLVVQTFSKSRSLAGGRLGFALGSKGLIDDLNRLRCSTNPYNVNRLTLTAGIATVDANDYYTENCRKIADTREYTAGELEKMGFTVLPSKTNFLFVKSDKLDGEFLYQELKSRGILIRHFSTERIKDYNRITIGTMEQMDALLNEIRKILG